MESAEAPLASNSNTNWTLMRVPRMHGLPPRMAESNVIHSEIMFNPSTAHQPPLPHHLLHNRLNQLRSPVLGAAKLGFELVAEFHQVSDFGDDAFLFGKGGKRNWDCLNFLCGNMGHAIAAPSIGGTDETRFPAFGRDEPSRPLAVTTSIRSGLERRILASRETG
jgi:hypothetical protein